jgi:hypothetical protein
MVDRGSLSTTLLKSKCNQPSQATSDTPIIPCVTGVEVEAQAVEAQVIDTKKNLSD